MSLNDPKWGRGGNAVAPTARTTTAKTEPRREPELRPQRPQRPSGDGPPDLDELWRDFNRRLSGLFGRRGARRGGSGGNGGRFGGFTPDGKGAGFGLAAVLAVIALIWLGSGFYIVPEGQVSVVTTFGKASDQTTVSRISLATAVADTKRRAGGHLVAAPSRGRHTRPSRTIERSTDAVGRREHRRHPVRSAVSNQRYRRARLSVQQPQSRPRR